MMRIVVSILIVCLIGVVIGIALAVSNGLYTNSGTFEDFTNMDGNWESAADALGPLQVEASRKVYINIDDEEDVFSCNSSFMSYAENPMFAGNYLLSTTINIPGVDPTEHGGEFNGAWWDYEANGHRRPQVDDEPQDINLTSAYGLANGAGPEEPEDPKGSGSDPNPSVPAEFTECQVNAHVQP